MCLKAISSDFLDNVLPKPALSGDEDDLGLFSDRKSSCLGGTNLLKFTTRSTILLPIITGLTLSPPFSRDRFTAGTEVPL